MLSSVWDALTRYEATFTEVNQIPVS